MIICSNDLLTFIWSLFKELISCLFKSNFLQKYEYEEIAEDIKGRLITREEDLKENAKKSLHNYRTYVHPAIMVRSLKSNLEILYINLLLCEGFRQVSRPG